MAQNKGLEIWNGLPPWAKGVVAVGGLAITYFVGRFIFTTIKSRIDTAAARGTQKEFQDDLRRLANKGIKPTYLESQYRGWADQIESQFEGCDTQQNIFDMSDPLFGWAGTYSGSGKLLVSIVKNLKNDADFAALVGAYGVRTYDQCGNIFGLNIAGRVSGNLFTAIIDELDQGERNGINKFLESKGITYRI